MNAQHDRVSAVMLVISWCFVLAGFLWPPLRLWQRAGLVLIGCLSGVATLRVRKAGQASDEGEATEPGRRQRATSAWTLVVFALLPAAVLAAFGYLGWQRWVRSGDIYDALNDRQAAKVISRLKAEPRLLQREGPQLLMFTGWLNRPRVARFLVTHGIPTDVRDSEGRTPLHAAAKDGCDETAVVLIEHGADVNATDERGRTPLHAALEGVARAPTIELLLEHGSAVDVPDDEGQTPTDIARKTENPEILQLLEQSAQGGDGTEPPIGPGKAEEADRYGNMNQGKESQTLITADGRR